MVPFLFNRLVKLAGTLFFYTFFFLLHNFVLSPLEILKNIFPLAMHPKSTDGHRHGKGIIESGWICGVLGWGSDNPKLCLIARVKMAPIVGVASVFIKAVWRGIGLSIRALHTFVLWGVTVDLSKYWPSGYYMVWLSAMRLSISSECLP